jgi:ZIP family zinc transporter
VFFAFDLAIGRISQAEEGSGEATPSGANLAIPMVLAIILDGVPESMVIGLGLLETSSVSLALLAAVFVSNIPEAIAGTKGLEASGRGRLWILMFWSAIALLCASCTVAGYAFFGAASNQWIAFVQAFAGGAILMMLANSMIPEAYARSRRLAGVFTVLGFWTSLGILLLESSA